jgi:hypothetical protein
MANNTRYQNLRYPYEAIYPTTDYLQIGIAKYTASGVTAAGGENAGKRVFDSGGKTSFGAGQFFKVGNRKKIEKVDYTIKLPIPSNIQDGNSVKFTEGSLDGLTAQVLGLVQDAFKDPNDDPAQIITNLLRSGTSLALDPGAHEYFLRSLATAAANIPFGGNLTPSQLLARTTGNILNPNMELLFDGVNLRSFKFSFKMTPRNKTEAQKVKEIIHLLKRSMAPGFGNEGFNQEKASTITNLYLTTPKIFKLTYMKGNSPHPFLHKFKDCALTDISVNYTGEGTYATYGGTNSDGGGTPVSMVMDLGFKELEPIYNGDYSDSDNGVGF